MLYKIEQPIYPIELYIHIGKELSETLHQFINVGDRLRCDDNWDNCYGKVYREIIHKEHDVFALIVAFEEIPNNGFIAHEITHFVNRLYEHIGQTNYGDENNAYLMEFLFNEIDKAIIQYKELNKE